MSQPSQEPAPRLKVGVYRLNCNSTPDTPEAWEWHRLRASVAAEAASASGCRISEPGSLNDEAHTHEFVEFVLEVLKQPTTQVVASALAVYLAKILLKPLDDKIEKAVAALYARLGKGVKKQEIDEFFITLPNGEVINVSKQGQTTISAAGRTITIERNSITVE